MFVYGGTSERAIIMEDLLEFKFGTTPKIFLRSYFV